MEGPPENNCCSVCHGAFQVPCQANCSHWFCGNCIMQVWYHGPALQPCKCPLCRREITLLVPGEASLRQRQNSGISEVLQKVETYNRRFGSRRNSIFQRVQDLPFIMRRLLRELMDPQRSLPLFIRARVYIATILSVVYILSPVDFVPEAMLGIIGYLDDLIIALVCILHVAAMYRSLLYLRHGGS